MNKGKSNQNRKTEETKNIIFHPKVLMEKHPRKMKEFCRGGTNRNKENKTE